MRDIVDALGRAALLGAAAASLALPRVARAQQGHDHDGAAAAPAADEVESQPLATDDRALVRALLGGDHLRLTPERPPAPGDSARAAAVAAELRRALVKYEDVAAAEADGYRRFAPRVREQAVYHYVSPRRAWRERREFVPSEPSTLLYRKGRGGRLEVIGAMYTAPRDATPDELNARVPLSVARWHAHVNFCVVRRGAADPAPAGAGPWAQRFTVRPEIATAAACDRAGGHFVPQLFGWMVHANVMAADTPEEIWGHGGMTHGAGAMD
jgi:hypothetical protein